MDYTQALPPTLNKLLGTEAQSRIESLLATSQVKEMKEPVPTLEKQSIALIDDPLAQQDFSKLNGLLKQFLAYPVAEQSLLLQSLLPRLQSITRLSSQEFLNLFEESLLSKSFADQLEDALKCHQQVRRQLLEDERQIQLKNQSIIQGTAPAAERLKQIGDIYYLLYQNQKSLTKEKQIFQSELTGFFQKQKLTADYLQVFHDFLLLSADCALSESAITRQLLDVKYFPGLDILQQIKSRRQLYTQAQESIKQSTEQMRTNSEQYKKYQATPEQIVQLKEKHQHLQIAQNTLDASIKTYEQQVKQAQLNREQCIESLEHLLFTLNTYRQKVSFDELFGLLFLPDPEARHKALLLVIQLLGTLQKEITNLQARYKSLHGSSLISQGLIQLLEKNKSSTSQIVENSKNLSETILVNNGHFELIKQPVPPQTNKEWELLEAIYAFFHKLETDFKTIYEKNKRQAATVWVSEQEAYDEACKQIEQANQQIALGIVDLAWSEGSEHQGFYLLPLEVGDWSDKLAMAQSFGYPLVYVLRTQGNTVEGGGRMPLPKGIFAHGSLQSNDVLPYQKQVTTEVGKTVQRILYYHCKILQLLFNQWLSNSQENFLFNYLLTKAIQSELTLERLIVIFALDDWSLTEQEQLWQALKKIGSQPQGAQQQFRNIWIASLQESLQKQLPLLATALEEIQALKVEEAALVLAQTLPFLREETFRLVSFRTNPGFEYPLEIEETYFSSTAELAFFQWLNTAAKLPLPKSLASCFNLLELAIKNLV